MLYYTILYYTILGTGFFPGENGVRAWREIKHSLLPRSQVKKWVELNLYEPYIPSWYGFMAEDEENCTITVRSDPGVIICRIKWVHKSTPRKRIGGAEVLLHIFLNPGLDVRDQVNAPQGKNLGSD
jgi:hypothetical protein